MPFFALIKRSLALQYLISFVSVVLIALVAHYSVDLTGYKVVALILLLVVSILAMIFDMWPVLATAVFSALLWNFFFIPPIYNFTIDTPEDGLLFLMYFVIALVNAVLTSKIRRTEMKAKEEEERLNTIKLYNTVLNSLSHELKTPIATIIGAVDTLQENPLRLSDLHKTELLKEIHMASTRLNRQVENLLNMSRLESGFIRPQRDWCDLGEIVHRVIQSLQEDRTGHVFEFAPAEEIPLFRLDHGLIEQVLYNILHNALQYTPAGSRISIRIAHEQQACVIHISDNGPGFPEGEIEAVFKKFYRLPHSASGGTGLGLSIVKGFVEAHQGTVTLEHQAGGGAHFTISIPAEASYLNEIPHD